MIATSTALSFGFSRAYDRRGMNDFTGVFGDNPGLSITATRNTGNGNLTVPLLFVWPEDDRFLPPAAGKPTFQIGEDEMEMGVGIHGEPGRRRVKLASADAIADEMMGAILGDLKLKSGSEVILLVNGFGGTPAMELYLMFNAAKRILDGKGVKVARSLVGSYVTSLEMAGCSLTVSALDGELTALWDSPVHTAALRWGI